MKINKIHGSKFKSPDNIRELEIYKKHNIIYCDFFHAIIIGKKLFNLTVYNETDYEETVEFLIENEYDDISFDFNHIHQLKLIDILHHNLHHSPLVHDKSQTQFYRFHQ